MEKKKYIEIYDEIRRRILFGEYKAGEKLPSKRVCADKNGCSVITVERAYGMLADEGYVSARERSGYFVNSIELPAAVFSGTRSVDNGRFLEEDDSIPDKHDFEYSLWFKTIRKVLTEKGEKIFIKSPGKGIAALRNAISSYLHRYRGISAPPERIIIGSGAEQLYEIVVKILGRDKVIGIENPSYSRIEAVYNCTGVSIRKLKLLNDGIDNSELMCADIDVLHVTPFRSYPTDITVSVSKKYEYLNWIKDDRYIVEDDFNSEFFAPGRPVETLYQLDSRDSVIYINTFSKSLSPSIRMGYMILPERLLDKYDSIMGEFSCSVPVLDQYVLSEFISNGNFERHLNRMRKKLNKQS